MASDGHNEGADFGAARRRWPPGISVFWGRSFRVSPLLRHRRPLSRRPRRAWRDQPRGDSDLHAHARPRPIRPVCAGHRRGRYRQRGRLLLVAGWTARFLPAHQDRKDAFLATIATAFLGLVFAFWLLIGLVLLLAGDRVAWELLALAGAILTLQAAFDLHLELARSRLSPVTYGLINLPERS